MTYTYLGDGTRAAARAGASSSSYAGKRYRGTFVYDVTAGGVQSLESVAVSTGRLIALTGTNGAVSFESDGFITDHLGNVAVVVNLSASSATATKNAILEQNEYTPFGTKLSVSGLKSQTANRWRYAGKEEQDIAGMNLRLLDFGARYYDSFTCRWNAVDPLAHKYFPMSPYNYCENNPVNMVDKFGLSSNEFYNEDGELLLKTESGDNVYIVRTSQTYDNSPNKNKKEAFSNSISKEEAQQTEELLKEGDLLGVNPKNLVKVASIKTLKKAAKIVKDDGHSIKAENMKEYGGTIESDNSVVPAKGYVNNHNISIPTTDNTVSKFHSHQSLVTNSGMMSSDYPSKADMRSAEKTGTTDYLILPKSGRVLVYDGKGVHATFPLRLIK